MGGDGMRVACTVHAVHVHAANATIRHTVLSCTHVVSTFHAHIPCNFMACIMHKQLTRVGVYYLLYKRGCVVHGVYRTGESGKSTVVKQMKIIHGGGFTATEKNTFRDVVHANIITAMHVSIWHALHIVNQSHVQGRVL